MTMNNRLQERLLRAYVRQILLEQGGQGGGGGESAPSSPGQTLMGDPRMGGALYTGQSPSEFLKPFVNVLKTVKAETGMAFQSIKASLKVALAFGKSMLTSTEANYEKIFSEEKAKLKELRNENKEVYDYTKSAFTTGDFPIAAGLCYPGLVLGGLLAKESPEMVLGFIDAVTGKDETVTKYTNKIRKAIKGDSDGSKEIKITNDDIRQSLKEPENSEVKKIIDKSMNEKGEAARKIVQQTLQRINDTTKEILKAGSFIDMKNIINTRGFGNAKELSSMIDKMIGDGEEKIRQGSEGEKELLKTVKKQVRDVAVKILKQRKEEAIRQGLSDTNSYVKMYDTTIRSIESTNIS